MRPTSSNGIDLHRNELLFSLGVGIALSFAMCAGADMQLVIGVMLGYVVVHVVIVVVQERTLLGLGVPGAPVQIFLAVLVPMWFAESCMRAWQHSKAPPCEDSMCPPGFSSFVDDDKSTYADVPACMCRQTTIVEPMNRHRFLE